MGPAGPAGDAAPGDQSAVKLIDGLMAQLDEVHRDLKVQFTRIAQLQADLDQLRVELRRRG